MNVGFVGLGTMGLPMARQLMKGGRRVVDFDLDPDALERHRANGGDTAASAEEAARSTDAVVTMLPEARHVRAALLGPAGAADGLGEGGLVVEMSTTHPLESDARPGRARRGDGGRAGGAHLAARS